MNIKQLYQWEILFIDDHPDIGFKVRNIPFGATVKQAIMLKNRMLLNVRQSGNVHTKLQLRRIKPKLRLEKTT